MVACIVNISLYRPALRNVLSGWASWVRMASASRPPTRKKNSAVAPYIRPSFLWSTVKSHDRQPVLLTGRPKMPRAEPLLTKVG